MQMLRLIFIFALVFMFNINSNAQMTLNDVTLPAKISVDNQSLLLNGGGVRSKVFFKLYTIGLYLQKKSSDGRSILNANETMAIRFEITSDMINSDNMSEAIIDGFESSTNGKTAPFQTRIDEILKTFSSEGISPGDLFELVYKANSGTAIYKNGKLKSTIKGADFKKALFGIWISDNPINNGLRKDLLGI